MSRFDQDTISALSVISELESNGGELLVPLTADGKWSGEQSFGKYHISTGGSRGGGMFDAWLDGNVEMPAIFDEIYAGLKSGEDFEALDPAARNDIRERVWDWMLQGQNPDNWKGLETNPVLDRIAEEYYAGPVMGRSLVKGHHALGVMYWNNPSHVQNALRLMGKTAGSFTPDDIDGFISASQEVEGIGAEAFSSRARNLVNKAHRVTPQQVVNSEGDTVPLDTPHNRLAQKPQDKRTHPGPAQEHPGEDFTPDHEEGSKRLFGAYGEAKAESDEFGRLEPVVGKEVIALAEKNKRIDTINKGLAESRDERSQADLRQRVLSGEIGVRTTGMANPEPIAESEGLFTSESLKRGEQASAGLFAVPFRIIDFVSEAVSSLLNPNTFDLTSLAFLFGTVRKKAVKDATKAAAGTKGASAKATQSELTDVPSEKFAAQIAATREKTAGELETVKNQISVMKTEARRGKVEAAEAKKAGKAPAVDEEVEKEAKKQLNKATAQRRDLELKLNPEEAEASLKALETDIASVKQAFAAKKKAGTLDRGLGKQIEAMESRSARLAHKIDTAKKLMKPVRSEAVTEVLRNNRALVESIRLPDELRKDMARGMVIGRETLEKNARKLEETAVALQLEAEGAGLRLSEVSGIQELRERAGNLRGIAARLGDTQKTTVGSIIGRNIDELITTIQATADEIVAKKVTKRLDDLVTQYRTIQRDPGRIGDLIPAEHEVMKQFQVLATIGSRMRRSDALTGQRLRIIRERSSEVESLLSTLDSMPEGSNINNLTAMWSTLTQEKQRTSFVRSIMKQKGAFYGLIEDIYLNSLISAVATPFWNIPAVVGLTVFRINERRIAARFQDSLVAPGEAGVILEGIFGAYWKLIMGDKAIKAALNEERVRAAGVFSGNVPEEMGAKLGMSVARRQTFKDLGGLGDALNWASTRVQIPRFAVATTDAYMRFALKDGFGRGFAFREAHNDLVGQLNRGAKLTLKEQKTFLKARTAQIFSDPNATTIINGNRVFIRDIAENETAVLAMMAELKTPGGRELEAYARRTVIGRMLVPYFRVLAINARETAERTLVAPLLASFRADWAAGGARRAEAKAKQATGAMVAATTAVLWQSGIVTDSGPIDPQLNATERAGGILHETIKIPGTDFSMDLGRFGVAGQVILFWANGARVIQAMIAGGHDPSEIANEMIAVGVGVAGSEILFNDVEDIMRAVQGGDADSLRKLAEKRAGGFVPFSALGQDISEVLSRDRKSAEGVLQQMIRKLPLGDASGLSTARNYWGDKTSDFSTLNPVQVMLSLTTNGAPHWEEKNRIARELVKHRVAQIGPSKSQQVGPISVQLTTEQHNTMLEEFGKIKRSGLLIWEAIAKAMTKKQWTRESASDGPDGSRDLYMDAVTAPYKRQAVRWLFDKSKHKGELSVLLNEALAQRAGEPFDATNAPQLEKRVPFELGVQ